jgi:hypothetical protein
MVHIRRFANVLLGTLFVVWMLSIPACGSGGGGNDVTPSPISTGGMEGPVLAPIHNFDLPMDSGDERYYTSGLQSDYGKIGGGPSFVVSQQDGALHLQTATVQNASSWAGVWVSLNETVRNAHLVLDPARPLPWPIKDAFQPRITGVYIRARGYANFRIELKQKSATGAEQEVIRFEFPSFSSAGWQTMYKDIPPTISPVKLLNIIAETGADLFVDEIGFLVEEPTITPLRRAFLLSLAQVLRCMDRDGALVRDHSNWLIGDFDTTPGIGFACLTLAVGADMDMITQADAQAMTRSLVARLLSLPAHASGWLPHWTKITNGNIIPHPDSEFSTEDTALAYLTALIACDMLALDQERQQILARIKALDFAAVTTPQNSLSHGFGPLGNLISSTWTDWGSETTLLRVLGKLNNPKLGYDHVMTPPVYRGNGFIMEMAALLFSQFGANTGTGKDTEGNDWHAERLKLVQEQKTLLGEPIFLGGHSSCEIVSNVGNDMYLVSGALSGPAVWDAAYGSSWTLWSAPHYTAMISSLDTTAAAERVTKMRDLGLMHPLLGPAESFRYNQADWSIAAAHTKVISINAFFNVLGYYHGLCASEGRVDGVYKAVSQDPELTAAVEAVW